MLERLYKSNKFEFSVINGRRRIGKTTLINEFLEDKIAVYLTAVESDVERNLKNLSMAVSFAYSDTINSMVFESLDSALRYLFEKSLSEKVVLVIDEYPYLAEADKSFASTLQMYIDRYHETSKMLLILCGSSMSFMETHVLGYQSPLYGRRTAQIKLEAFDFNEFKEYFNHIVS